ncbi:hypothetical protein ACOME3_008378 [Neoechinorhynchus agilis]
MSDDQFSTNIGEVPSTLFETNEDDYYVPQMEDIDWSQFDVSSYDDEVFEDYLPTAVEFWENIRQLSELGREDSSGIESRAPGERAMQSSSSLNPSSDQTISTANSSDLGILPTDFSQPPGFTSLNLIDILPQNSEHAFKANTDEWLATNSQQIPEPRSTDEYNLYTNVESCSYLWNQNP